MKKNFETFDLWSKAQFNMWSNARYDFELIAELTRYRKSTSACLELLNSVNKYLKNPPDKVFFDGTIKCLKYLVSNNYLNISDLPTLLHDEKYLVELLEKYSKRLDITDIIADIEEPTIRAILLEYPNLLNEVMSDNPIASHFLGLAMQKNGIKDVDDFTKKVDDGLNSIEVDKDKNSKEAMKCKIIYIGLLLYNHKFKISGNATETVNQFASLTDDSIENQTYIKGTFNSMYSAMYGFDEWSKEKKTRLSGCDTLFVDFQLLSLPDNHMSLIYKLFLKDITDEIGKKYFGEEYQYEGFIASLAIKMVIVIILFRAENFVPEGEKPDTDLFSAGALLGTLNFAVEGTGEQENPFRLKKWFADYFRNELDKRIAFIKLQVENNVGVYVMKDKIRAFYIPVFESFRFFCSKKGLVEQTIDIFKNKTISNEIKDDVFINFVINIQKIIADEQTSDEEKYFKDAFILLIYEAFKGLSKKISWSLHENKRVKKYYETKDTDADAYMSMIELIIHFDLSKNDSFIAYMNSNLRLSMISATRMNKTDSATDAGEKHGYDENFWDEIPDGSDFVAMLDDKDSLEKIRKCIESLPEKEKQAVKKMAEDNEKLNDTERKAKNRGLNKIREMVDKP